MALLIEEKYHCPACKNDVHAHLHSGVTAVFCNYCHEKIEVKTVQLKTRAS